jgi:hypothetical protein
VGKDIARAKSSVLFSLALLGQMKNGPIGPALGKQMKSKNVHTLGIADAKVKEGNLGVTVLRPDNKKRVVPSSALTQKHDRGRPSLRSPSVPDRAGGTKGKGLKVIELKLPPTKPSQKPWWQKDWDDPVRKLDRVLFA